MKAKLAAREAPRTPTLRGTRLELPHEAAPAANELAGIVKGHA